MKRLLLLIPVIVIIGCGLFGGEDFFPLKVGNIWKYTGYTTMQDTAATTVDTTSMMVAENEITGTVQIGGADAYVSVTKLTNYTYIPMVDTTESVDTSYIQESNDTIWSYDAVSDTTPMITMVLPLEQDKTWSQVMGTDTITYTVIAKEDITVPAETYTNCWKVEMTHSGSDQKAYYWYADGTGTVKYYNENMMMNYLIKFWYELTEATL
jgi:hypothetical protein